MTIARNVLLLGLALLLIGIAVPRFIAAVVMASGTPGLDDISAGKPVSDLVLADVLQSRQTVVELTSDMKAREDLVYLLIQQDGSQASIENAIQILEEGLATDPIDDSAWALLAKLRALTPGGHGDALIAWKTSRAIGPYEYNLYNDRAVIGILLFAQASDEDRALIKSDLERAYARNRRELNRYLKRVNLTEWAKLILNDPKKTRYLSLDLN